MDDPGTRIVTQHLHSRRRGRKDFHDVTTACVLATMDERLPMKVDRVVVEGGPQPHQVPSYDVTLGHDQALDVAVDETVDGVHLVALDKQGIREDFAIRGALLDVVLKVPA